MISLFLPAFKNNESEKKMKRREKTRPTKIPFPKNIPQFLENNARKKIFPKRRKKKTEGGKKKNQFIFWNVLERFQHKKRSKNTRRQTLFVQNFFFLLRYFIFASQILHVSWLQLSARPNLCTSLILLKFRHQVKKQILAKKKKIQINAELVIPKSRIEMANQIFFVNWRLCNGTPLYPEWRVTLIFFRGIPELDSFL